MSKPKSWDHNTLGFRCTDISYAVLQAWGKVEEKKGSYTAMHPMSVGIAGAAFGEVEVANDVSGG